MIISILLLVVALQAQTSPPGDRPASVKALLELARKQSVDGNFVGALQSLTAARALAPNSEEVLSGYARVSLSARRPVPAILTLEALTRICPTVAQYHYLLGVAMMQAGDMETAVESLEQAERLEPGAALTLTALGLALNHRKLYADAKAYLARSVEVDPQSVDAVAALAEAEEGLGELDAAAGHARAALDKSAGNATANLVVGLVLMKRARYAEARDALLAAAAADPASPKIHYQLSLAYARLGDDAASRKHVALYQQKLREMEERVKALRTATGVGDAASPR